jgi:hypothetical protein
MAQTGPGYTFGLTFDYALSNVYETALMPFEFQLSNLKVLSYSVMLTGIGSSVCNVAFNPKGGQASIRYMAFTVVLWIDNTKPV